MGGAISRLRGTLLTRPLQRFNAESRAQRVLERQGEEAARAPKFPSDEKLLEELRETHPEVAKELTRKDDVLHQRLRQVYVTSTDPADFDPDSLKAPENPDRPLPQKLSPQERSATPEHAFLDQRIKPRRGKASLEKLQEMVALNQRDPRRHSPEVLAEEHGLDPREVANLVRHYRVFDLYQGEDKSTKRHDPLLPQPDWEEAPDPNKKTLSSSSDPKAKPEEKT